MSRWGRNSALGWLGLCLAFPMVLFSQTNSPAFSVSCLNLERPAANTVLFLELGPTFGLVGASGFLETDLEVHLSFKTPGTGEIVYEKRFRETQQFDFFSGADPFFREYTFDLPTGAYELEVDLRNHKTRHNHLTVLEYECRDFQTTGLSDILLLRETEGALDPKPLVGESVTGVTDRIRFQVEVYSPQDEVLTARMILYRGVAPSPHSDDGDRFQVNRYTSIVQLNEVMAVENGRAVFTDGIDLFDLDAGRYLFEIFLYRDDSLIVEQNAFFELPWKRLREVFFDLDQSIEWMGYVAGEEKVAELKAIEGTDEKLQAFRSFWEQRAEPGRETGTDVLERYYGRIFYANEFLAEDSLAGWQTERGRIYALYGAPDRREMVQGYDVWQFQALRLNFIFAEENQGWRQVYPVSAGN